MHENPSDPPPPVKRYAPPNLRNRGLNRRKSGERFERISSHSNEGEKNLGAAFQTIPGADHADVGSSHSSNESFHPGLISLNGCCRSEASQLLRNRWEAVTRCYEDPSVDLSERPVMYIGSAAPAWGNFGLPHQLISGQQMDFLGELRRAMQKHNSGTK